MKSNFVKAMQLLFVSFCRTLVDMKAKAYRSKLLVGKQSVIVPYHMQMRATRESRETKEMKVTRGTKVRFPLLSKAMHVRRCLPVMFHE